MLERNPIKKVSKYIGKQITVSGFIKERKGHSQNILYIGRLGDPIAPKYSTMLPIIISKKNLMKFKGTEIVGNYANVTGYICCQNGKLALELNDPKDFKYEVFKTIPVRK